MNLLKKNYIAKLRDKINAIYDKRQLISYHKQLPVKVAELRQKPVIKVLFVLNELAVWKTEMLYLAMKRHPRFDVIIGLTISNENSPSKNMDEFLKLTNYLDDKGYKYVDLVPEMVRKVIKPDIVFYQKPYKGFVPGVVELENLPDCLSCFAQYAFNTLKKEWAVNSYLCLYSWLVFCENEETFHFSRQSPPLKGKNRLLTGLPFSDELMLPKKAFSDPWKSQNRIKKRIIWAPHYSISSKDGWLFYSTFLKNAEIMLSMAQKYKDYVQFAFKPHPLLANRLDCAWGREKRMAYYHQWETMENTQVSTGKYLDLFKYSDAMIHDSCSFTVEYHYTHNPVMYLLSEDVVHDDQMQFAKEAFDLHYKGTTAEDIEQFIQNVIKGVDPRKEERLGYYNRHLVPPHNKTACENIVNAILGEEEYKE